MTDPFEPCPFCGGAELLGPYRDDVSDMHLIHCSRCMADIWNESAVGAIAAWNRRAIAPAPSGHAEARDSDRGVGDGAVPMAPIVPEGAPLLPEENTALRELVRDLVDLIERETTLVVCDCGSAACNRDNAIMARAAAVLK